MSVFFATAAQFDVGLVQCHRACNVKHMLYTDDNLHVQHGSVSKILHPDLPPLVMKQVLQRLHKLKLSTEETCLFMALQLLFTGEHCRFHPT